MIDPGFITGVAVFIITLFEVPKIIYRLFIKDKIYETIGNFRPVFYIQYILLLGFYVLQAALLDSTKLTEILRVHNAYNEQSFGALLIVLLPWGMINVLLLERHVLYFQSLSIESGNWGRTQKKIWVSAISNELIILWAIYYGWKDIFYMLIN